MRVDWSVRRRRAEYTHLDRFSPQYNEALCTLHHETSELMAQNSFNLVCLFDLDTESDGVYRGFDEHSLVFISGDDERVQEDLLRPAVVW